MILQWKKVSRGQRKAVHHVLHVRTAFSSPGCGIHDPLCWRTELHASPDQENDWWVCLASSGGVAVAYNMRACFLPIFICLLGLAIAIVRGRFPEEMLPKTFEREKVWSLKKELGRWHFCLFLVSSQVDIPRAPALGLLLDSVRSPPPLSFSLSLISNVLLNTG